VSEYDRFVKSGESFIEIEAALSSPFQYRATWGHSKPQYQLELE
jgi:hypothetical protein